jgi:hydroxypyruvate isomerase
VPRFAANISTLFSELPPLERFGAAAAAGFAGVEMQYPYALDIDDLVRARDKAGVDFVLINTPAGDPAKGDRGIAALPDRVDEMKAGIERARRYAEKLGVRCMHLVAGRPAPEVERARARATFLDNMRRAARAMAEIGVTTCLEPINTFDVPGFFLSRPDEAIALIDACGEKNIALQFDFYHMQRMQGELIRTFERLMPRIAHVQFADTPGRHEPGTGEINFASIFATIDRSGYGGWVGAEYNPSRPTAETLDWLRPYRRR